MSKNKLMQTWAMPPTWLRVIIAVLLILGVFFRFVNLDRKAYWYDETYTSLRISGYKEIEVVQDFFSPQVRRIEEVQKYQRLNPEKTVIDTLKSLATEDSQHPPIYYLLARFWAQLFGSSVAVMRTLPALISLLVFPCIYWLCLELFESSLTGWFAVGVMAISPLQLLYAQEAREYSLWTVTILLSSVALLRAVRLRTKISWGIYAVTWAISLYTFLFSALVAIGYGFYIWVSQGFRLSKTVIAYFVASIIGLILYTPWLLVIINNSSKASKTTAWTGIKRSLFQLIQAWINNISINFLDVGTSSTEHWLPQLVISIANLSILILIGYSLYFIYNQTPPRVALFVLTLIGVPALLLMLPDVILGGQRSTIPRYLLPSYLGINLAVAYLLAAKVSNISVNIRKQKLWQFVTLALFSSGVISCAIISQSEVWWNKNLQETGPVVARFVNQVPNPLLIGSARVGDLLALSHLLNPKVQFMVAPQCDACDLKPQPISEAYLPILPQGLNDVFLLKTGSYEEWLDELKKNTSYKTEPIVLIKPNENLLWRLQKQ